MNRLKKVGKTVDDVSTGIDAANTVVDTANNLTNQKKEKEMSDKKYIVMSKFGHGDRFMMEKAFSKREDANTYAKLMIDTKEYDDINYFCFEQTMPYLG